MQSKTTTLRKRREKRVVAKENDWLIGERQTRANCVVYLPFYVLPRKVQFSTHLYAGSSDLSGIKHWTKIYKEDIMSRI